ncbi:RING-7 protein [Gaeumannomyces tritici R3-111a-1]|uniref:RING-type E3 ubiquitin transferase n=1 Tax=Gaeumannomyces tritici (strain R3-111a-1) TaxID=644352 RepID=J3PHL2_GAET3|nr:RING-7 protein [Gaeumannomyces tritici R3-111a-1]EJT69373.1 RING-7 protein [Gaeumannomyces tritici R3-111a-1]
MASLWSRRLWPALIAAAAVSAQQPQLQTFPLHNVPTYQKESAMTLQISAPSGGLSLTYDIVPFTMNAGLDRSETERGAIHIHGPIVVATETTYNDISNPSLAYLNCDRRNGSSITSQMMLNKLMEKQPVAILLYSTQSNCCGLSGLNGTMPYESIFTMTDVGEAIETLNMTNSGNGWVQATIVGNATNPGPDVLASGSGNNSAVAMSILYSITGLITLLFLVIIGTGAVRAHRYPERYGPRAGYGGRPSQSRAKGIARAVLDTLPIVKFGAPAEPKPDPALELESAEQQRKRKNETGNTMQVHHLSTIPEDAEAVPSGNNSATRESRLPAGDVAAAAATLEIPATIAEAAEPVGEEHLGCSICTDDFLVGEDVRVLPCDHKFHPPCIDPWLINVSGTCPLCRLDLQPHNDETSPDGGQLSPPLGPDPETTVSPRQTRRSSRLFDLARLRHASVEERIEGLRQYRHESRVAGGDANEEDERSSTSRLTQRLREKFRVRTRAQSPPQAERTPQDASATP